MPGSSKGRVMRSSHSGSTSTPASVHAMTGDRDARTAAFLPTERFPGARTARILGSAEARVPRISHVPSVEPPSAITISSGTRVPERMESRSGPTVPASFRTVTMRAAGSTRRPAPRTRTRWSPSARTRLADGVRSAVPLVLLEVLEADAEDVVRRDPLDLGRKENGVVDPQAEQIRARELQRARRVRVEGHVIAASGQGLGVHEVRRQ